MYKSKKHIIRKELFEFEADDKNTAYEIQKKLAPVLNTGVPESIDNICSKYSDDDTVVIDKIEIDLGEIELDSLEEQLLGKFNEEFEYKINDAIKNIHHKQIGIKHSPEETNFDLIKHFLLKGYFPWWVEKQNEINLDTIFFELMEIEKEKIISLFTENTYREKIIQRFVKQFDGKSYNLLIVAIKENLSDEVILVFEWVERLAELLAKELQQLISLPELTLDLYSLSAGDKVLTNKKIIEKFIEQVAVNTKIGIGEISVKLIEIIKMTASITTEQNKEVELIAALFSIAASNLRLENFGKNDIQDLINDLGKKRKIEPDEIEKILTLLKKGRPGTEATENIKWKKNELPTPTKSKEKEIEQNYLKSKTEEFNDKGKVKYLLTEHIYEDEKKLGKKITQTHRGNIESDGDEVIGEKLIEEKEENITVKQDSTVKPKPEIIESREVANEKELSKKITQTDQGNIESDKDEVTGEKLIEEKEENITVKQASTVKSRPEIIESREVADEEELSKKITQTHRGNIESSKDKIAEEKLIEGKRENISVKEESITKSEPEIIEAREVVNEKEAEPKREAREIKTEEEKVITKLESKDRSNLKSTSEIKDEFAGEEKKGKEGVEQIDLAEEKRKEVAEGIGHEAKKEDISQHDSKKNIRKTQLDKKKDKIDTDVQEQTKSRLIRTEKGKEKLTIPFNKIENESNEFVDTEENEIYIENAGLVLVAPFLPRFFESLKLVENSEFKDDNLKERGVNILQYLVNEREFNPEFMLQLNKLLCGMRIDEVITSDMRVTENEKEECNQLLESIIKNWQALKNTSVQGLRNSFLERKGVLKKSGSGWTLNIEKKAFDILLDTLPWSIAIIKLKWMQQTLFVEW
ncbi:MAG: contractile injection system tape measure protein [Ignavibacteria bacterium]|jgi:hypothetical protein